MNNVIQIYLFGKMPTPPMWLRDKNLLVNRLYVIYGGTGYFVQKGQITYFEAGHFYLFPSTLDIDFYVDDTDPLVHLFFDFFITPNLFLKTPINLKLDDYPILKSYISVFETIFNEYNAVCLMSGDEQEVEFVNTLIRDIDNIIYYINKIIPIHQVFDERVNTAISYIHKHYQEHICIKDLAKLVHTDQNNFIKIFKKVTSQSPYQYIKDYRFTLAITMLKTGIPVNEVAEAVGYESIFSFSNAIKKRLGVYPTEIRSQQIEFSLSNQ